MITAPACSSLSMTVAEVAATWRKNEDPQVVATPLWLMMSLTAIGTPANGPGSRPRATSASICSALDRAVSSMWVTTMP